MIVLVYGHCPLLVDVVKLNQTKTITNGKRSPCYNAPMPSEPDKHDKLIAIIADQLAVSREKIAERMSYLDEIAIDSLDVEEIVLELEEEFGDSP